MVNDADRLRMEDQWIGRPRRPAGDHRCRLAPRARGPLRRLGRDRGVHGRLEVPADDGGRRRRSTPAASASGRSTTSAGCATSRSPARPREGETDEARGTQLLLALVLLAAPAAATGPRPRMCCRACGATWWPTTTSSTRRGGTPRRSATGAGPGRRIDLVNGGAAMRVKDGAHRESRYSIQTRQVNPAVAGNDDWKAGVYSATGVPTLRRVQRRARDDDHGLVQDDRHEPEPRTPTPRPRMTCSTRSAWRASSPATPTATPSGRCSR